MCVTALHSSTTRQPIVSYESPQSDDYGHHWTPSSPDEAYLTDSPQQELGSGLADHRQRNRNLQSVSQLLRRRDVDDTYIAATAPNRRRRTYSDAFSDNQGALSPVLAEPIDAHRKLNSGVSSHELEQLKRNVSAALSTLSFAAVLQPLPLPTAVARKSLRHEWWVQQQAATLADPMTTLSLEEAATHDALASSRESILAMHRGGLTSCEIAARLGVPHNTVAARLKLDGGSGSALMSSGKTALLLARVALASADLLSAVVVTEPFAPFLIVHVNPAWVALCGYTAAEAIGETCAILEGPLTSRNDTLRIMRVAERGLPASLVVQSYAKIGERFTNSIVSLPLRDATAAVAYLATVLSRILD